jgi:hypothetical protein
MDEGVQPSAAPTVADAIETAANPKPARRPRRLAPQRFARDLAAGLDTAKLRPAIGWGR